MNKVYILFIALFIGCGDNNAPSIKYINGDDVLITKGYTQLSIDLLKFEFYRHSLGDNVTVRNKTLGSESCLSLGFQYIETVDKESSIEDKFKKGQSKCSEVNIKKSFLVGDIHTIFFIRKSI